MSTSESFSQLFWTQAAKLVVLRRKLYREALNEDERLGVPYSFATEEGEMLLNSKMGDRYYRSDEFYRSEKSIRHPTLTDGVRTRLVRSHQLHILEAIKQNTPPELYYAEYPLTDWWYAVHATVCSAKIKQYIASKPRVPFLKVLSA